MSDDYEDGRTFREFKGDNFAEYSRGQRDAREEHDRQQEAIRRGGAAPTAPRGLATSLTAAKGLTASEASDQLSGCLSLLYIGALPTFVYAFIVAAPAAIVMLPIASLIGLRRPHFSLIYNAGVVTISTHAILTLLCLSIAAIIAPPEWQLVPSLPSLCGQITALSRFPGQTTIAAAHHLPELAAAFRNLECGNALLHDLAMMQGPGVAGAVIAMFVSSRHELTRFTSALNALILGPVAVAFSVSTALLLLHLLLFR